MHTCTYTHTNSYTHTHTHTHVHTPTLLTHLMILFELLCIHSPIRRVQVQLSQDRKAGLMCR